jgi:hypothetical protein
MCLAAAMNLVRRVGETCGAPAALYEAIAFGLAPVANSVWPSAAWKFSGLTRDGFPLEFGFSDRRDALRVTFEAAGPEAATHDRLDLSLACLAALGLPAVPEALAGHWRILQKDAPLNWGCWVSLRQIGEGFGAKLYVEPPPGPRGPRGRPHMIGYDLLNGEIERYFTWPPVTDLECELRLKAMGAADPAALMAALEAVIGMPRAAGVKNQRLGVSFGDGARNVALFLDSRLVVGGPASLRRRLAPACPSYAALLGERADADLPEHGVLTLGLGSGGVELRANFSARLLM